MPLSRRIQAARTPRRKAPPTATSIYSGLAGGIGELLATDRRASPRSVNTVMTATCWEIGRPGQAAGPTSTAIGVHRR